MNKLKTTPLGEVLFLSKEQIELEEKQTYKQITIRLNHKGVAERGQKKGAEILSKQFVAKTGQFIISRIDARNGAMGIVPNELQGAIVTNDFLLFDFDKNAIDLDYLNYLTSTRSFDKQCKLASEGTTNRVRLKLEKFLSINIFLPTLPVQKAIVQYLDNLKSKCDKALHLRLLAEKEVEALKLSMLNDIFKHEDVYEVMTVGDICNPPQYGFSASATRKNTGIQLVRISDIQKGKVNWKFVPYCYCDKTEPYLLNNEDILFARTGGTTGKSFFVKDVPENAIFASYLIRVTTNQLVLPEYLYLFFQSPLYWDQIYKGKRGTGQPNFNSTKLSNIKLPIPSISRQEEIIDEVRAITGKVQEIRNHQQTTNVELKALFPSVLDEAFKGEW